MTAFLLLFALSAADLKPFPEWNDQTVLRLLTQSPWSHPRNVKFEWHKRDRTKVDLSEIPGTSGPGSGPMIKGGSPVGGIGVPKMSLPPDADILIRWNSALPIRQATALYKIRDEKRDPSSLNALIGAAGDDYALEIFGLPAVIAHQGTGTLEVLATQGITLRSPSGRKISPARAVAKLTGLTVNLTVFFPRTAAIDIRERYLDVDVEFQVFHFTERFSLRDMAYLGHLEM